jgi:hypothetical protein
MAAPAPKEKMLQAPKAGSKPAVLDAPALLKSGSNQEMLRTLATWLDSIDSQTNTKKETKPFVDHFENDLRTVVFNRPVTLQEAKQVIWRRPPVSPNAIVVDKSEAQVGDRQTRFKVEVRDWLAPNAFASLSDSVQTLAAKSLPVTDPVKRLEEAGLPHEIAIVAPNLKYERFNRTVTESVPWNKSMDSRGCVECHPAPVVVGEQNVVRLHRFPGIWMVHGKQFPGDWLVQNRHGIIEAWQLKPDLDAYVEALNGDEENAKRHHDAAKQREGYVLRYWEEGHPLDDAMGLMRWETEIDFKSAVWSAAGTVQMAGGAMSRRTTLEEPTYSNTAVNRAGQNVGDKYSQSRSVISTPPNVRTENEPIPVSPGLERSSELVKSARIRNEPPANPSMRARVRETRSGGGRAVPKWDTGESTPPGAGGQRAKATGTEDIASDVSPTAVHPGNRPPSKVSRHPNENATVASADKKRGLEKSEDEATKTELMPNSPKPGFGSKLRSSSSKNVDEPTGTPPSVDPAIAFEKEGDLPSSIRKLEDVEAKLIRDIANERELLQKSGALRKENKTFISSDRERELNSVRNRLKGLRSALKNVGAGGETQNMKYRSNQGNLISNVRSLQKEDNTGHDLGFDIDVSGNKHLGVDEVKTSETDKVGNRRGAQQQHDAYFVDRINNGTEESEKTLAALSNGEYTLIEFYDVKISNFDMSKGMGNRKQYMIGTLSIDKFKLLNGRYKMLGCTRFKQIYKLEPD